MIAVAFAAGVFIGGFVMILVLSWCASMASIDGDWQMPGDWPSEGGDRD